MLAHELNHALEDQHYDLSDRLGTGDRDLALTSLVEGTATVAMIRYARRFQNTLALALAAGGIDGGTEGVPPFIVDQLLFAYTGGARFVRALYEETGSWAVVNNALESDPPVSSEQIMHPRKYLLNEGPLEFAFAIRQWRERDGPSRDAAPSASSRPREMLGDGARLRRSAAAGWGADSWACSGSAGGSDPLRGRGGMPQRLRPHRQLALGHSAADARGVRCGAPAVS